LNENHEHLLSASFDASFGALWSEDGHGPSSSEVHAGFDFLDPGLFGVGDEHGLEGGIGDELAQELGEGWGMSADQTGDR
jgi:meiotic recombination protein REC8, fungi type